MKKKGTLMACAIVLSFSVFCSSCIGSFGLTRKLHSWNMLVSDDPWVNELIFFSLTVFQVYSAVVIVDGFILNTIEFWTGENPADQVQVKEIETENGKFTVTTDANGHRIQKQNSDETVEFRFNKDENSWSLITRSETIPLVQFFGDHQAKVYLADGTTTTVSVDEAGVTALRQIAKSRAYFAVK